MKGVFVKEKAIKLRKDGYSYSLISERTGVSKSTLSCWLSKIPYVPNQETKRKIGLARTNSIITKNKQRLYIHNQIKLQAEKDIGVISKRDLFMLGVSLYIGEGAKTYKIIRVINADLRVINLAIRWFCEICLMDIGNFSLAIHLYPDNDINDSLKYWHEKTGIPLEQFGKTQIDRRKNKTNIRKNKLPHGTAHLTVRSNGKKELGVLLFKRIEFWMDIVLGKRD